MKTVNCCPCNRHRLRRVGHHQVLEVRKYITQLLMAGGLVRHLSGGWGTHS